MYKFYLFCVLLSLLFLLLEKYNKFKTKILCIIMLLLVAWIMINGNNEIGDLDNYEKAYYNAKNSNINISSDIGYNFLMYIGNKLGLSFLQFKSILILFSLSLILNTLTCFTNYAGFFFFFYLLHSVFLDASQIRNFLSIAIVIYGLKYLLNKDKSVLYYLFYNILAVSVHFMAVAYFVFIFIRANETIKKWSLRILVVVFAIIFYFSINTNFISDLIVFFSDFVAEETSNKLLLYSSTRSRFGFLAPTLIYISNIFFIKYLNHYVLDEHNTVVRNKTVKNMVYTNAKKINNNAEFFKLVEQISTISIFFLPFNVVSLTFYRLVRNIFLFDLIYYSVCFDAVKSISKKILIFLGVMFLIILWRYFDFNIYLEADFIQKVYFYN